MISPPSTEELRRYFLDRAETILHEPKGLLKHHFVTPGGGYRDQLWDWDSFWVSKGLLALTVQDPEKRAVILQHAMGSWKNFFDNQAENGTVSILITPDNPDVFKCSGSALHNQAKPIMAEFALEIIRASGDHEWITPYFERLKKFHMRWADHYLSECGLLVWGSDVAIGVDNDPTTYGRPPFSSANLLLNCLYVKDLEAAAEIARLLQRKADAAEYQHKVDLVKKAIQTECWDEGDGFYYTVDVQCKDQRDKYLPGMTKGMYPTWKSLPFKTKVFTGFLPMWCQVATESQAETMVKRHLRNSEEFNAEFGVRTLARNEKMYDPDTNSSNPSNWLGPIWILTNYLVFVALKNYGYDKDAAALAEKTTRLLQMDLETSGTLHEYYQPDTGEPNFNNGFYSWNVLASLMTSENP